MQQFYRRTSLEEMLGISRSTIYRMMHVGEFPRPIKLGRRAVGWREDEIEQWLRNKANSTDHKSS